MEEDIKILEEKLEEWEVYKNIEFATESGKRLVREEQAIENLIKAYKEDEAVIEEIKKEVRDHIGFENRLKRESREPDLFNQGRFYVANNIKNILEIK